MSVQLSAPEQKSEEKTEEVAMHRGQQGTSGSRGREGAADVKVEGAANVKVVGQGGAGGGEAGKCGALAGLEGVVVLRGKDGCIGMTPHQIMYEPAEEGGSTRGAGGEREGGQREGGAGALTSALLKQIDSVDIGAQDEVQVLGAAGRLLLSAGPLSSYDVTELSTFFGHVKRRSDFLRSSHTSHNRASSDTLTSASSEPPPPPPPPPSLPLHPPPIPLPPTPPARTSGESSAGLNAREGGGGGGGGMEMQKGGGGLEGPRALERMEREAGLNGRTVLKRVEGKDNLLILTTHALFLFGLQSGALLHALLDALLHHISTRNKYEWHTGGRGRVAAARERCHSPR